MAYKEILQRQDQPLGAISIRTPIVGPDVHLGLPSRAPQVCLSEDQRFDERVALPLARDTSRAKARTSCRQSMVAIAMHPNPSL
jgi:hypothetical protein